MRVRVRDVSWERQFVLADAETRSVPVTVFADPAQCSLQFDPVGTAKFITSCDIAKSALAQAGVDYTSAPGAPGILAFVHVGGETILSVEGSGLAAPDLASAKADFAARLKGALAKAGYPAKADPAAIKTASAAGFVNMARSANSFEARVALAKHGAEEKGDFTSGMKLALISLLTAPEFAFRIEMAEPDPVHRNRTDGIDAIGCSGG